MPTVLQRARAFKAMMDGEYQVHGTNTHGEPLYMPKTDTPPRGQVLGSRPKDRRTTPPDSQQSGNNLDRTPPPHQKVLPWVAEIQTEGYQPPEGMFGPYDSQPPTRPQTIVNATTSNPLSRPNHPFTYEAGTSLPFAALSSAPVPIHQSDKQNVTRESEVMSRGAGMGGLAKFEQPRDPGSHGARTATVGLDDMGEGQRSELPSKFVPGRAHTEAPSPKPSLPPSPIAKSVTSPRKQIPVPNDGLAANPPRIHPAHHDFPFSHAEAAQKQTAAMAEARARALAQLETAKQDAAAGMEQSKLSDGPKGPRKTYETSTSGPSFGHILHQHGLPLSMPGPPLPPGHPQSVPMSRDLGGNDPFMRIPFGVPMGASIQRPLFVMRSSSGVGMGVGLRGQGLQGPTYGMSIPPQLQGDSPLGSAIRAKDARSAYVETIEDEQAHTATNKTPTGRAISALGAYNSPQAVGKNGVPSPQTMKAQTAPSGSGCLDHAATRHHDESGRSTSSLSKTQRAQSPQSNLPAHHQRDDDATVMEDARSYQSRPVSVAPTTASNVKKLVAASKYHDETLCQLLDAAQLNLIGKEAKRALNRAARTRITELKELRTQGESQVHDLASSKKSKDRKWKDRHGRTSDSRRSEVKETPEPTVSGTPAWANEIMSRLEAFDARFSKLEKQERKNQFLDQIGVEDPPSQDFAGDLLDDLIYNELGPEFGQLMGFARFPSQIPAIDSIETSQRYGGGYQENKANLPAIQSYAPIMQSQAQKLARSGGQDTAYRASDGDADMIWGSEVELPAPEETVPPPRHGMPMINVQPPTESNIGKSSYRAPSGPTYSQAMPSTPSGLPRGRDMAFEAPGGVIQGRERDLPAAPSESLMSQRQSPVPPPDSMPAMTHSDGATPKTEAGRLPPRRGDQTRFHPSTAYETAPTMPKSILQPERTYSTPPRLNQVVTTARDGYHTHDGTHIDGRVEPWSLITQKLYLWALVWEEETFARALERISLGHQVEEFSLTIFMMMTYKRLIRHNLTSTPSRSCDKLFVPPTIAAAINAAVHNKQFDNAAQFLAELWESYQLSDEPPRVIISLAKHRNENDLWTAHRFDLTSHHLTSYGVSHDEQNLKDGRPFMWWYAIRLAWPQCSIPDPYDAGLQVRFEHIRTTTADKTSNSLVAANMARNLLLGYRPERPTDLAKMRELIWAEVKRLLQKKRGGKLVVDAESTDHTFNV